MLLQQKVMLISREVIERARQRDEQLEVLTEVWTRFQGPTSDQNKALIDLKLTAYKTLRF